MLDNHVPDSEPSQAMNYVLLTYPRSGSFLAWCILQTLCPNHRIHDWTAGNRDSIQPLSHNNTVILRCHNPSQLLHLDQDFWQTSTVISLDRRNLWDVMISVQFAQLTGRYQRINREDWRERMSALPEPVEIDYQNIDMQMLDYLRWKQRFLHLALVKNIWPVFVDFDKLTASANPVARLAKTLGFRQRPDQSLLLAPCHEYVMPYRAPDYVTNYSQLRQQFYDQWPQPWITHRDYFKKFQKKSK